MRTITLSPVRQSIENMLKEQGLTFVEFDSRMNYGMIGHLKKNDEVIAIIYPKCFYIHTKEFSLNNITLTILSMIQTEFEHLTREGNKIVTVILNELS
jgi:hypothetical protein